MKPLFFRLISGEVASNCFKAIHDAVQGHHESAVTVTIGLDDEKARTLAQNRLYWLWVATVSEKLGNDKDDQHLFFKRAFLSKIYARDDAQYAQMADAITHCKRFLSVGEYENLAVGVVRQISTTKATTGQFKEYLDDIERWAYSKEIRLPLPPDLEWVR